MSRQVSRCCPSVLKNAITKFRSSLTTVFRSSRGNGIHPFRGTGEVLSALRRGNSQSRVTCTNFLREELASKRVTTLAQSVEKSDIFKPSKPLQKAVSVSHRLISVKAFQRGNLKARDILVAICLNARVQRQPMFFRSTCVRLRY